MAAHPTVFVNERNSRVALSSLSMSVNVVRRSQSVSSTKSRQQNCVLDLLLHGEPAQFTENRFEVFKFKAADYQPRRQ